jgi:hypothetical protein
MSIQNLWDEFELYFYCEFINKPEFPESKKLLLQKDLGCYFINKDFTIYQEKAFPFEEINETDFDKNFGTFICILYNLPFIKVRDFLQFHYEKYNGEKINFLNYVYHELKASKSTQGNRELPPPQQKVITLSWCEEKIEELNDTIKPKIKSERNFINVSRIEEVKNLEVENFDFKKLVRMLEEINDNYSFENYLSVSMLGRSIIDHIPPLFNLKTFNEVANNYGNASFKKNMGHLNVSMRSIADNYLHMPIRKNETLPNENQIDFSRELDFLLAEIIRTNKK